jgi:hypothetical protein
MNSFDPTQFFGAFNPQQAFGGAAGYARITLAELEKQAERWTEYVTAQAAEGQKLLRSLQTQAFGVGKSMIDAAEKATQKAGA